MFENLALWRESLTLRHLRWVEDDGESSHAGIRTIVLRLLPDCYRDAPNRTLHMALFTIAGAIRDTHVTLEVRTWDSGHNPWPFLEVYWKPSDPTIPSGVLALAATLTALEVCMQQGSIASGAVPEVCEEHNPATVVSPAVQMSYDFTGPATDGLRCLCSLSRLETASLWLEHRAKDADDAYDGVWQSSNQLSALRHLALQCASRVSDVPMHLVLPLAKPQHGKQVIVLHQRHEMSTWVVILC